MARLTTVTEAQVLAGLDVRAVDAIAAAMGLSASDVAGWAQIAPRTWARRRQAGTLDPLESDRIARAQRLIRRATSVLGGPAEARAWLTAPSRALGRRTPWEVARTEVGAEQVFALLGRLEHGVFT